MQTGVPCAGNGSCIDGCLQWSKNTGGAVCPSDLPFCDEHKECNSCGKEEACAWCEADRRCYPVPTAASPVEICTPNATCDACLTTTDASCPACSAAVGAWPRLSPCLLARGGGCASPRVDAIFYFWIFNVIFFSCSWLPRGQPTDCADCSAESNCAWCASTGLCAAVDLASGGFCNGSTTCQAGCAKSVDTPMLSCPSTRYVRDEQWVGGAEAGRGGVSVCSRCAWGGSWCLAFVFFVCLCVRTHQ